ncbi:MAG: S-layer homology domain-containing protein, partial [Synergistaceae bacterium]|nr:S-layer homology domain-containing protein [Synergistaceae bacterium]
MLKKFLIFAVCTVFLVIFSTNAVFAATNPFMDVPLNHWSYDAIGQLAARGVLSGYPDGTYKGKQPTTRYEMASALARALAVVDMGKASRADVDNLKRLVVEFKDELDALGVKVEQLDKRVAVMEERLGGWQINGELRMDIEDWKSYEGD